MDEMSAEETPPAEESNHKIRIEVPEAFKKVNEEVWEELENYLFTGFLSSSASILKETFIFKTLNHTEIRNIEFMKPFRSSVPEAKDRFRTAFIAHSVFMIDGENFLHDRPRHFRKLMKLISRIPTNLQQKIINNLASLNSKASRLYPLTEVYVHENRSRFKWMQYSNLAINSQSVTGIPGTDEIGISHCQSAWVAMNKIIDRRDQIERDWGNAKFIGSCFAGKGVRSIDERDKTRLERERQELDDLKIKVLYNYLNKTEGQKDAPQITVLPDGRRVVVEKRFRADSVEDLADQLSAALSGEKDHHDLVVESQQRKVQERSQAIHDYHRSLYAQTPQFREPGSRILGGKLEADAYLARIQALRLESIEKGRNMIPAMEGNNESYDETQQGKES